jgi:hypothetical protein
MSLLSHYSQCICPLLVGIKYDNVIWVTDQVTCVILDWLQLPYLTTV